MVSNKNSYFTMAYRAFHAEICNGVISQSYSLITAWLHSYKHYGYYITTHSSVIFRSLHYCRPGLVIETQRRAEGGRTGRRSQASKEWNCKN